MRLFIQKWLSKQANQTNEISLEQATALLLLETANADYQVDASEEAAIRTALQTGLNISTETANDLFGWANSHRGEATSLFPFTRVLNDSLSPEEKTDLMRNLWRVAYADGRIDKYEVHYLRQLADLLYLPHSLFIRAKLEAAPD